MVKNINFFNKLMLFFVLLINFSSISFANQEPAKKSRVVLTNSDFSTTPPEEPNKDNSNQLSKPDPKELNNKVENQGEPEKIPDIDLQFRQLDLQLALAQDPENRILHSQQIEINNQLRQAPLIEARKEDLRDLDFRKRFIALKVALINADRGMQMAGADVQQERRKVIKGSQGNSAFDGVRGAEGRAEALYKQKIKLEVELNTLIEEGRRLGVSARVFR